MRERIDESYRFALEAARAALIRNTGANNEGKRSLIEAVWWIAAADEYLREAYGGVWDTYKKRHKRPELLSGIRWARHRAIHDPLSLATLTETTHAYSDVYADVYGTWAWCPLAVIDKIDPTRRPGPDRANYASVLVGRPIADTLNEAIATLDGLDIAALEASE